MLWPFLVYGVLVVLVAFAMLGISYLLGQRHREPATGKPYESGIIPFGSARIRFNVNYYLVAVMFVIFDLESIFIYTWAVSLRENGWMGFYLMAWFIAVLVAALVYLWRSGVLDQWRKRSQIRVTAFGRDEVQP
ncbi:MAG: NADH-quinone oxidoreductase subunit A [Candidatus Omnitrophota bacterium]